MAKELAVKTGALVAKQANRFEKNGFVLVTALIMLSLLSLLSIVMYMSSRSATQVSAAAQSSTEAYYYAETAINYMTLALSNANDAEIDSFAFKYPTGAYVASPPLVTDSTPIFGDKTELMSNTWDPGPRVISDTSTGITGQLLYFDNSPLATRAVKWPGATTAPPTMYHISHRLPRYIKMDMDIPSDGNTKYQTITLSIPKLPHRNPPQVEHDRKLDGTYDYNGDIPRNGAIVWLTGGTATKDIEYAIASACTSGLSTAGACDATTKSYIPFSIVVYAIGYVNGKPSHLLRVVIM